MYLLYVNKTYYKEKKQLVKTNKHFLFGICNMNTHLYIYIYIQGWAS
jgi:hypothetical protein